MTKVLACAPQETVREIQDSAVWREEFERQSVPAAAQAISQAASFRPNLILIDRDLPAAEFLLRQLRSRDDTRNSSIVVLARGEQSIDELGLLDAGANAVLRLPPSAEWDARVEPLLRVPTRKQARIDVNLKVLGATSPGEARGRVTNLSTTGMLLDSASALSVGSEVRFRMELSGFETSSGEIQGTARVVRLAGPGSYGLQFLALEESERELIRRFLLVR